jgi:peptide subunit release factor 1 (eRF1)
VVSELEKSLERLRMIESPGASILSVYLSLHPERAEWRSIQPRLRNLLDPIETMAASGDLTHDSSMALRSAIEEVMGMAASFERLPGKGVAVFICPSLGLRERLTIPGNVWDCAEVGPTPYLRPLQAALDEYRTIGVVVLDSRGAEILLYRMGEVLDRQIIEVEELRKSDLAGWHGLEEQRHRQHGEEVRNQLLRQVAEILSRLREDPGIELVLVGGQREVTEALLPFLEPKLRAITDTFVTDLHTLTPGDLTRRIAELEESVERREEATKVDDVYSLSAGGDLGAIGLDRVCQAVNRHAVAQLLVHDGAIIQGSVCRVCGAVSGEATSCAECGGQTQPVTDVFEVLARMVGEAGGSVEHVMADTMLAQDLVAARLRFDPWAPARLR